MKRKAPLVPMFTFGIVRADPASGSYAGRDGYPKHGRVGWRTYFADGSMWLFHRDTGWQRIYAATVEEVAP